MKYIFADYVSHRLVSSDNLGEVVQKAGYFSLMGVLSVY